MSTKASLILGVAIIIAGGLVGGRFTETVVSTEASTGVFVLDRLTGNVRYCGASSQSRGCLNFPSLP